MWVYLFSRTAVCESCMTSWRCSRRTGVSVGIKSTIVSSMIQPGLTPQPGFKRKERTMRPLRDASRDLSPYRIRKIISRNGFSYATRGKIIHIYIHNGKHTTSSFTAREVVLGSFREVATAIASSTVKLPCSWLSCMMQHESFLKLDRLRSIPLMVMLPSMPDVLGTKKFHCYNIVQVQMHRKDTSQCWPVYLVYPFKKN